MKYGLALASLVFAAVALAQEPTPQTPREPIVKDFDTLDKDGDGVITRAEADDENIFYHWDAIDKNKDDVVTREEFVNYIADEQPLLGEEVPLEELPQAHLRERTQQDTDVVTNPELLPKIRNDFDSLDENEDRHISREEAQGDPIFDHFAHMDADSDGRISVSEYNEYLYRYGTQVATQDLVEQVQQLH